MKPSPAPADSARLAAAILNAWDRGDPRQLDLVLDQALAIRPPRGGGEEERQELLRAIVGRMRSDCADAQVCQSLLAHLSCAAH